jgi:prepilin-type N-terminal cleavage/methylation domain-containing protein
MTAPHRPAVPPRGFTLVELTIVLLIIALLIGGMMASVSATRDVAGYQEAQKQIAATQEAVLGFAAAHGRLPCPASGTSNGLEEFCLSGTGSCTPTTTLQTHGRCAVPYDGYVPAATLGLSPTTASGLLADPWGNGMRYAVSQNSTPAATPPVLAFPFTANSVASSIKIAWSPYKLDPDLIVCSSAAGVTNPGAGPPPLGANNADCPAADRLTNKAVAVIHSSGKNGTATPTDPHELANWTTSGDRVFVARNNTADFDDAVTWLSPNTLYNRLISAGRLP